MVVPVNTLSCIQNSTFSFSRALVWLMFSIFETIIWVIITCIWYTFFNKICGKVNSNALLLLLSLLLWFSSSLLISFPRAFEMKSERYHIRYSKMPFIQKKKKTISLTICKKRISDMNDSFYCVWNIFVYSCSKRIWSRKHRIFNANRVFQEFQGKGNLPMRTRKIVCQLLLWFVGNNVYMFMQLNIHVVLAGK